MCSLILEQYQEIKGKVNVYMHIINAFNNNIYFVHRKKKKKKKGYSLYLKREQKEKDYYDTNNGIFSSKEYNGNSCVLYRSLFLKRCLI